MSHKKRSFTIYWPNYNTFWDANKCIKCTYDDLHRQKPHTKTQVKQSTQANNNSQIWITGQTRGWEKEKFTHRSLSLSFSLCRLDLCSSPIRMTAARMPAFLELTLASESDMLSGSHSETDFGPGLFWCDQALCHRLRNWEYTSPSTSLLLMISLSLFSPLTRSYSSSHCLPVSGSDRLNIIQATPTSPQPLPPNPSLTFPSALFLDCSAFCCQTFPHSFNLKKNLSSPALLTQIQSDLIASCIFLNQNAPFVQRRKKLHHLSVNILDPFSCFLWHHKTLSENSAV